MLCSVVVCVLFVFGVVCCSCLYIIQYLVVWMLRVVACVVVFVLFVFVLCVCCCVMFVCCVVLSCCAFDVVLLFDCLLMCV